MSPALLSRLLLLGLALVGLQTPSVAAYGKNPRHTPPAPAEAPRPLVKVVAGSWQQKLDDAKDSAVDAGLGEVLYWLKQEKTGFEWEPDQDYVRKHLLKDLDVKDGAPRDAKANGIEAEQDWVNGLKAVKEKKFFPDLGPMYRVRLQVEVTPDKLKAMAEQDRKYRAEQRKILVHERQLGLGKFLLGALAFFGAVAGFFRLNQVTKGSYTAWLGVGAAGVVAAV